MPYFNIENSLRSVHNCSSSEGSRYNPHSMRHARCSQRTRFFGARPFERVRLSARSSAVLKVCPQMLHLHLATGPAKLPAPGLGR